MILCGMRSLVNQCFVTPSVEVCKGDNHPSQVILKKSTLLKCEMIPSLVIQALSRMASVRQVCLPIQEVI